MIKANELRVGNLLNWESDHIGDGVSEVIAISKIGYKIKSVRGCHPTLDEYNRVNPILLTPEWLERCGFALKGPDDFHDKPLWKHPSTDYLYCEGGNFVDNDGPYGHYCDIGDVRYVHQLQNLFFALTGEELTINHEHL